MISTQNKEIELILSCSKTIIGPASEKRIRSVAKDIANWNKVIFLATFHRVLPLVYTNLQKICSDLVPKEILKDFKKKYSSNAFRNLSLTSTLIKLLNMFETNGVKAVSFKGPLLGDRAYGDLNLRTFSDLDILIRKKDVFKVQDFFSKNGFTPEITLKKHELENYLDYENSISFYSKSNITIDLHWELTGRYLLKPIYFEDIEPHLKETSLLEKQILYIPDHIMLVYLSAHGLSHCWDRLEWLCCFSELAVKAGNKTLAQAMNFAIKKGAYRILLLGLYLSHELLNSPYSSYSKKEFKSDNGVKKCSNRVKKIIFSQKLYIDGEAEWRFSPVHILMRDSFGDQIKYFVYLFTMPTIKEWSAFKISPKNLFLYRIIRPFRLFITYISKYFFRNSFLSSLLARFNVMVSKKKHAKSSSFYIYLFEVPMAIWDKISSNVIQLINKYFFNKQINLERLNKFHRNHKKEMINHFYIIAVPGKIHFLEPCLELIQDHANIFLILNGITKKEKLKLVNKFPDIPMIKLKSFLNSTITHGEVINLLIAGNESNFGLIDHDLYIFNPDLFNNLEFNNNEFIAGPFKLINNQSGIQFPTTFFLFLNTQLIKKIMCKYKVGAQIYTKIPKKIIPILKEINIGYHNFLKDYLNYFDPFNLIFALAYYEGYKCKFIEMEEESLLHLGGALTDDLTNQENKTVNLLNSIRAKTYFSKNQNVKRK